MKRKVVQQGPKTLGISLPAKWINRYGIDKGSELDVTELQDQLLIQRTRIQKKQVSEITIDSTDKRHIRLLINNAYRGGTDKLKISFSGDIYDTIKHITTHFLLGFEITKRGTGYCIIENITEPEEGKYETILRRIFLTIIDSAETTIKTLEEPKVSNHEHIVESTYLVGKYDNFCKRMIVKGYEKKSHFYFLLNNYLLLIQHSFWHLHEYAPKKTSKELIGFAKDTESLFRSFYHAFYEGSIQEMSKINEAMEKLIYNKGYRLFNDKKTDKVILYQLCDVIRNTHLACSPALGILVN